MMASRIFCECDKGGGGAAAVVDNYVIAAVVCDWALVLTSSGREFIINNEPPSNFQDE
jgi:hypothetical protein